MDAKLKKKLVQLRNKKNQRIFQHAAQHRDEHERQLEDEQALLTPKKDSRTREQREGDEEVWSAKVQQVRNRLTDKKRDAKDRWNRFAGTEEAGAMGR